MAVCQAQLELLGSGCSVLPCPSCASSSLASQPHTALCPFQAKPAEIVQTKAEYKACSEFESSQAIRAWQAAKQFILQSTSATSRKGCLFITRLSYAGTKLLLLLQFILLDNRYERAAGLSWQCSQQTLKVGTGRSCRSGEGHVPCSLLPQALLVGCSSSATLNFTACACHGWLESFQNWSAEISQIKAPVLFPSHSVSK